jgi:SAM-dependent methyltransferase
MKLPRSPFFRLSLVLPLALAACQSDRQLRPLTPPPEEISVKPGINKDFLDASVDTKRWLDTFEGEAREIAVQRDALVAALGLKKGMEVADVGAGTGLFLEPLGAAVGVSGKVFALDISPKFVELLERRAREEGLEQVEPRLSKERSVDLPPLSIDAAWVCDTYHHFEYPQHVLFSLYDALRPMGSLFVVDFERIPGTSRQWILDHVRADKRTTIKEIESAGFEFVREIKVEGLVENYLLEFRRP